MITDQIQCFRAVRFLKVVEKKILALKRAHNRRLQSLFDRLSEAEQEGVLESISKSEGETVNVGEVSGTIGEGNGTASEEPEAEEEQPQAEEEQPESEAEAGDEASNGHREMEDGAGRASPSVRKLAQEYEVDLAEVSGSGSGGRITRDDVERLIRDQPRTAAPEKTEEPERDGKSEAPATPPAGSRVRHDR